MPLFDELKTLIRHFKPPDWTQDYQHCESKMEGKYKKENLVPYCWTTCRDYKIRLQPQKTENFSVFSITVSKVNYI